MLKGWRPYFIIFVLGFLLFYQTLFFDLTFLDDQTLILENSIQLESQGPEGIFLNDAFFSDSNIYYRPILNLSFWLEMKIDGANYFIFHLFNILFHVIATWLIFLILKKMKVKKHLAFFFSLIFLVHPALTQAVAWIPGRNDSLLTVFVLASFLLLLNFLEKEKLINYLGHFLLLLLALFTKETAVFAPAIFFLFIILINRKKIFSTDNLLLYLNWGAALFIYLLIRGLALSGGISFQINELLISVKENLVAFVIASGKVFFPFNLKVLPIITNSTLWYGWLTFAIIILLFIFLARKNWRQFLFGLVWFIVFLLPTLLLHNKELGVDFHLEHRIYLPIVGIIFLFASFINTKVLEENKKLVKVVAIILIIGLATLNFIHSRNFKDRLTFWQSAVKTSPDSPLAHRNLGVMYYFNKNNDLAIQHYKQALKLNNEEVMAHNNIGIIYLERKEFAKAEIEFKKELEINPYYDKALFNLGNLYYKQGNIEKAAQFWQETLRISPNHFEAYQYLLISQNQLR